MLSRVFHFCLVHMICLSHEIDNFNDGWIPTTSDKVYSLLRRSHMKYPIIDHNAEAIHKFNNNFIKLMDTDSENEKDINADQKDSENDSGECKEQDETNCFRPNEGNSKQPTENYFIPNIHQNKLESSDKTNPSNTNNLRRAKVISEDLNNNMIAKNVESKLEYKYDIKDLSDSKEAEFVEENRTTYEVTESNEVDTPQSEQAATELGYKYETPQDQSKLSGNNLTNAFLASLSKHNIYTDDHLSNYDLSLRYNNQGLRKGQLASPVKLPDRYNSLNHLLVNPVLAVLLSNYGYYVPGQYGIQTNYNNLYGYLASNNIHNNRPFGLYKIFSDTDASSK